MTTCCGWDAFGYHELYQPGELDTDPIGQSPRHTVQRTASRRRHDYNCTVYVSRSVDHMETLMAAIVCVNQVLMTQRRNSVTRVKLTVSDTCDYTCITCMFIKLLTVRVAHVVLFISNISRRCRST